MWMAEALLRGEGFSTVEYVHSTGELDVLVAGKQDVILFDAPGLILALDERQPIVILGGIHGGCYELFGSDRVRSVLDLRGRKVGVTTASRQAFVAAIASYVGLVDAVLGFPPEPQELRARKIGRPIVNTARDRPWSQYFCCMAVTNQDFVRRHPVATKRALRALVKATEVCAAEPERVARELVTRGFIKNHDYSIQAIREVPYRRWREYDSADTVRFFALRMHEAGMIRSSPQKLIAEGTDWRFINELKRELKG
jgi:NitT/TauT family transport system substrate-binding protein